MPWHYVLPAKEHGKNNFAISSANHPTECDGYFGFAEVIFPVFLSSVVPNRGFHFLNLTNRSYGLALNSLGMIGME